MGVGAGKSTQQMQLQPPSDITQGDQQLQLRPRASTSRCRSDMRVITSGCAWQQHSACPVVAYSSGDNQLSRIYCHLYRPAGPRDPYRHAGEWQASAADVRAGGDHHHRLCQARQQRTHRNEVRHTPGAVSLLVYIGWKQPDAMFLVGFLAGIWKDDKQIRITQALGR